MGESCDDLPPPPYGDATPHHNYNLNIPLGSTDEHCKVRDKDLSLRDGGLCSSIDRSLNTPQYSRSVSAPAPPVAGHHVPYYSRTASAPPLDEEMSEGDNVSLAEALPLSQERTTSVELRATENSSLLQVTVTHPRNLS